MQIIREATARGVRVCRVHVVDLPLTGYLRYELAAYAENAAAGERVSIAVRAWHPDLAAITEDFVLFDAGTGRQSVVWMRYGPEGDLTGTGYSEDPADIGRGRQQRDAAMAHAVPLSEFAALAEAV
jgi:hypothetical protein